MVSKRICKRRDCKNNVSNPWTVYCSSRCEHFALRRAMAELFDDIPRPIPPEKIEYKSAKETAAEIGRILENPWTVVEAKHGE